MKIIIQFFCILIFVHFSNAQGEIFLRNFFKWQSAYNKSFPTPAEERTALKNFRVNYMSTLRHQLKYYTYRSNFRMKVNRYGGYSKKSFLNGAKFTDNPYYQPSKVSQRSNQINGVGPRAFNLPAYPTPPASLDYRNMGLVTPVEDQGYSCSSCYAFAAACGLEGQVAKKYGKLNSLSSQNIVDCSKKYGNGGCLGGYIGTSYKYILSNPGIANMTSYPYNGTVNTCAYNSSKLAEKILSYTFVSGDENYLKSVLAAIGPIPVGMRGNLDSFFYYSNGIYDDPTCTGTINHAVCIVGYGTDNTTSPSVDYWIVKNSWSSDWGENGYFRLKMGSNLCGITNYMVYPTI